MENLRYHVFYKTNFNQDYVFCCGFNDESSAFAYAKHDAIVTSQPFKVVDTLSSQVFIFYIKNC